MGSSVVLVRLWGIQGVAWATAVPLAVQSIVVIAIACRAAQVRFSTSLCAWTMPLLAGCFLAGIWYLIGVLFPPVSSWAALFGIGLGGLALYFPLLICLDPSLRRYVGQLHTNLKPLSPRCPSAGDTAPVAQDK